MKIANEKSCNLLIAGFLVAMAGFEAATPSGIAPESQVVTVCRDYVP
ncbi:MAG: hypothetical protein VB086_11620 [Clostridiaceae bacterium]|nr:hypothetical protein [Clostridiaceae bacterium]